MALQVVVHALDHALTACAVAGAEQVPLVLWSAPGGAGNIGGGWFGAVIARVRERHPSARVLSVLDCADEAGLALSVLRGGLPDIAFTGSVEVAAKLAAMGARIWRRPTEPPDRPVDLANAKDAAEACRMFLKRPDRVAP